MPENLRYGDNLDVLRRHVKGRLGGPRLGRVHRGAQANQRRRAKRPVYERACAAADCDQSFSTYHPRARYCSPACKARQTAATQRAKAQDARKAAVVWAMGWCLECGEPFVSRHNHGPRFCSRTCKAHAAGRRHAQRQADHVAGLKIAQGCRDCGLAGPADALHFHHRDPSTKLFNVGDKCRSATLALLLAEIAKCDVLCADCHRAEHARWKDAA